jgi:hypothetical protein
MARDPRRLARMLRVRTVARDLARADQLRAAEQQHAATDLAARLDALHHAVGPQTGMAGGLGLGAAAFYRGRLADGRIEAARRIAATSAAHDAARLAAEAANRDRQAVEKLLDRARADRAAAEARALEDLPHAPRPSPRLARTLRNSG